MIDRGDIVRQSTVAAISEAAARALVLVEQAFEALT